MGKPIEGSKAGWNEKTKTGWKYDGTHWIQFKNGKRIGNKEKHRSSTSALRGLGILSLGRTLLRIPSEKEMEAYGPGTYKNKKRSKEETEALNKSKNNIKNKNNEGPNHNENKQTKNTIDKKSPGFTTNVHTRHYKTGERLGVLTRNQRRAYEADAKGRTFEGEVAAFEKKTKHGKKHKRETLYKSHVRSGGKFTNKYRRN
tara:strand:+ start:484 stop:1086 length:603 start_codon:yes stop_codon:yes gene_type:complete